jgi:hypothetical protein
MSTTATVMVTAEAREPAAMPDSASPSRLGRLMARFGLFDDTDHRPPLSPLTGASPNG